MNSDSENREPFANNRVFTRKIYTVCQERIKLIHRSLLQNFLGHPNIIKITWGHSIFFPFFISNSWEIQNERQELFPENKRVCVSYRTFVMNWRIQVTEAEFSILKPNQETARVRPALMWVSLRLYLAMTLATLNVTLKYRIYTYYRK